LFELFLMIRISPWPDVPATDGFIDRRMLPFVDEQTRSITMPIAPGSRSIERVPVRCQLDLHRRTRVAEDDGERWDGGCVHGWFSVLAVHEQPAGDQ
jgi:hypothetical protein